MPGEVGRTDYSHAEHGLVLFAVCLALVAPHAAPPPPLTVEDLSKLRSVGDVQASPDGSDVAFTVEHSDRPGPPYSQTWIMDLATGRSVRLRGGKEPASNSRWSPAGRSIAYFGRGDEASGLMVARADESRATFMAALTGTNHPLPRAGSGWPGLREGRWIASSPPGPVPSRKPTVIRWSSPGPCTNPRRPRD